MVGIWEVCLAEDQEALCFLGPGDYRSAASRGKVLGPSHHSTGGFLQTLRADAVYWAHTKSAAAPVCFGQSGSLLKPRFPDGLSCLQPVSWIIGHWGIKFSLPPAIISKGTILSSFTLTTEKASSEEKGLLCLCNTPHLTLRFALLPPAGYLPPLLSFLGLILSRHLRKLP